MRHRCSAIPTDPGSRALRLMVALAVAPALVLSPLGAEAILIHYDGPDIHAHTVVNGDFDSWVETPEHEHAADDHDCESLGPHEHRDDVMIVLELPDVVLRMRGLGSTVVAPFAAAPSLFATAVSTATVLPHPCSASPALVPCPCRAVVGILRTNHALLL